MHCIRCGTTKEESEKLCYKCGQANEQGENVAKMSVEENVLIERDGKESQKEKEGNCLVILSIGGMIAALVIIAGLLWIKFCFPMEKEMSELQADKTVQSESQAKTQSGGEVVMEQTEETYAPWVLIYCDFLSADSFMWEEQRIDVEDVKYWISDLNNDDIPELILYTGEVSHVAGYIKIYTIENNKVVELDEIINRDCVYIYPELDLFVTCSFGGGVRSSSYYIPVDNKIMQVGTSESVDEETQKMLEYPEAVFFWQGDLLDGKELFEEKLSSILSCDVEIDFGKNNDDFCIKGNSSEYFLIGEDGVQKSVSQTNLLEELKNAEKNNSAELMTAEKANSTEDKDTDAVVTESVFEDFKAEINGSICKLYYQDICLDLPKTEDGFWEASYAGYDRQQERELLKDEGIKIEIDKELNLEGLSCTHTGGYERYESPEDKYPYVEVMIHDNTVQDIFASYKGELKYEFAGAGYDYETKKINYFREILSEVVDGGHTNDKYFCERTIYYDRATDSVDRYEIISKQSSKEYSDADALNYTFGEVISYARTTVYDGQEHEIISTKYKAEYRYNASIWLQVDLYYDANKDLEKITIYGLGFDEIFHYSVLSGKWTVEKKEVEEEIVEEVEPEYGTVFIEMGGVIKGAIEKRQMISDANVGGADMEYFVLVLDEPVDFEVKDPESVAEGYVVERFIELKICGYEGDVNDRKVIELESYDGKRVSCRVFPRETYGRLGVVADAYDVIVLE